MEKILSVNNLSISFPIKNENKKLSILDEVSFKINKNEVVGLVGESGSGKTLTALSIMKLLSPNAIVEGGSIVFQGEDIFCKNERQLSELRKKNISMIFQNPRKSLNPMKKVIWQVERAIKLNKNISKKELNEQALSLLGKVGFSDAANRAYCYPHQLSTGMCQRVMIAMMIAAKPDLLIADEPTTALDVTIADQIYDLLHEIKKETKMSLLLITHDLGVVAENCDTVVVMHAGHVVEIGAAKSIFKNSFHPYTKHLIDSLLSTDKLAVKNKDISFTVEEIDYTTSGCRYFRKCSISEKYCAVKKPVLKKVDEGHFVKCHRIDNTK